MKAILLALTFLLLSVGPVQSQEAIDPELEEAIRGASLSTRCQELIKKKNEKSKLTRRLNTLIIKVDHLLKTAPGDRKMAKNRLERTKRKLRNERELANMKVEEMEENIIRSGCPGIQL